MKKCRPIHVAAGSASVKVLAAICICLVAGGQVSERSPQDLAGQLAGNNAAEVKAVLAEIHSRLADMPWPTAAYVRSFWLKPLRDANRNSEALALCEEGILAGPHDTSLVEYLQEQRVELLQRLGKKEEALSQARALFNVCPMQRTEQALLQVAECLNAARGDESGATEKLVAEERAGIGAGTGETATSPTLLSIPIDAAFYSAAIRRLKLPNGDLPLGSQDLIGIGNLYLLAGQPLEAAAAFRALQISGGPAVQRTANEGTARAMRAQDGTVGRANAYAVALKPS